MLLKISDDHAPSYGKWKYDSELSESVEVFNQASPKKERQVLRKEASSTGDGENCKHCNCKRSRCLKLYCDCFAAGLYCAESCACQRCLNRHEYEDAVLEARECIESKNPLAFAPNVVQCVTNSPANNVESGHRAPISSLKHKKGCNCRMSMCLQKYCECYQANVGCSDDCRCEDCRNVFGKKEDYGMVKGIISRQVTEEVSKGRSDEKLKMLAARDDLLQDKVRHFSRVTPLKLSSPCANLQRNKLSKLTSGRYVLSSVSDLNTSSSCGDYPTPQTYSHGDGGLPEWGDESADHLPSICENPEEIHGLANAFQFTSTMVASPSSNRTDFGNISHSQFFAGSGHPSPSTSPITHLCESKYLQGLDSSGKHCDTLDDDDASEIPKHSSHSAS
ncbi:hypothetical protein Ancab_022704 [Ancistrocladus abbreviatus]